MKKLRMQPESNILAYEDCEWSAVTAKGKSILCSPHKQSINWRSEFRRKFPMLTSKECGVMEFIERLLNENH